MIKIKLEHGKKVALEELEDELLGCGVKVFSIIPPHMLTKIVNGVEEAPVPVDGEIEFEGDEKVVRAIIEAHDAESFMVIKEKNEAVRMAKLLTKYSESKKELEDNLSIRSKEK